MDDKVNDILIQYIDKKIAVFTENENSLVSNLDGDDEQTNLFKDFVDIATNFSKVSIADKLKELPTLVESISRLLQSIMEEAKEYADMARELEKINNCFNDMVTKVKHNASLIIPVLESAKNQLSVVGDVMNSSEEKCPLNNVDKEDIKKALGRMEEGVVSLINFSSSTLDQCKNADIPIRDLKGQVESKKAVIKNRLKISKYLLGLSLPASSVAAGFGAGALISSTYLGGAGVLVVSGMAIPPVGAVIGACLLGATFSLSVIYLVKRFWGQRQLKALNYLEEIFSSLLQLEKSNTNFISCMTDAKEKANTVLQQMKDIQICLESERQRKINKDVCLNAVVSTSAMIESLKLISNLKVSKTTNKSLACINPERSKFYYDFE